MSARIVSSNLLPAEIVRQAMTLGPTSFGLLYPDNRLLLIRLPAESSELVEGLASSEGKGATDVPPPPLEFHTERSSEITGLFRVVKGDVGAKIDDNDVKAWKALLAESRFFVVPIRKRVGADAMSSDRISVGRARNKDIVLRHRSVSKFHGWFQLDEVHGLCFMDTGSKNGTRLNDKLVEGRALVGVHPGDRLRIGRVEAIVCTPDALWGALHRTPLRSSIPRF
jgi:hypothetical protein